MFNIHVEKLFSTFPPLARLPLLRIEASDDDAAVSDLSAVGAGPGVVNSGAVAGFPMLILRYFVGAGSNTAILHQLAPAEGKIFAADQAIDFAWIEVEKGALYRLEVADANGKTIFSALLPRGSGTYRAPPWLRECAAGVLRWHVIALDEAGKQIGASEWRGLRFAEAVLTEKPHPWKRSSRAMHDGTADRMKETNYNCLHLSSTKARTWQSRHRLSTAYEEGSRCCDDQVSLVLFLALNCEIFKDSSRGVLHFTYLPFG